jgi:hypothetical protein
MSTCPSNLISIAINQTAKPQRRSEKLIIQTDSESATSEKVGPQLPPENSPALECWETHRQNKSSPARDGRNFLSSRWDLSPQNLGYPSLKHWAIIPMSAIEVVVKGLMSE